MLSTVLSGNTFIDYGHFPEYMITLDYLCMKNPYDAGYFAQQLIDAGVPRSSIPSLQRTHPDGQPEENLLYWLFKDIASNQTKLVRGERYTRFSSIYCTDRKHVLVERNPFLGTLGSKFTLGGLISFHEEPISNAIQELGEETPLLVAPKRFTLIGEHSYSGISPKLPEVTSHGDGYLFKYDSTPFGAIPSIHNGSDGAQHELLLIPVSDIRSDERVSSSYREFITQFWHSLGDI
jgi:hypothetical protein